MESTYSHYAAIAIIVVVALAGCTRADRDGIADSSQSRHWETDKGLEVELALGRDDTTEEELFGRLQCIAVDAAGGIYLFDRKVPALRYFDREGRFVRNVGQEGSGPGEYLNDCQGLVIRDDGSVAFRDNRNMMVHYYDSDGRFIRSVPHESGFFSTSTLLGAPDGDLYMQVTLGPVLPNTPWPLGWVRITESGIPMDTIRAPRLPNEPTGGTGRFMPEKIWTIGRDGTLVVGLSESYTIGLRRPDLSVKTIHPDFVPVELQPTERESYQKWYDWASKRAGAPKTTIPEVKPAFNELTIDNDGRLWVHLYTRGIPIESSVAQEDESGRFPPRIDWNEEPAYDVFDTSDGSYYGRVHAPLGFTLVTASGDLVWGTSLDSTGNLLVTRSRLVGLE